jgi:Zn ribbon nucleic-acid-binding protein
MQVATEGHYCLNPECGADSDHLAVWTDEAGTIHVGCYVCDHHGTES